jgi:hypothetical protein
MNTYYLLQAKQCFDWGNYTISQYGHNDLGSNLVSNSKNSPSPFFYKYPGGTIQANTKVTQVVNDRNVSPTFQ